MKLRGLHALLAITAVSALALVACSGGPEDPGAFDTNGSDAISGANGANGSTLLDIDPALTANEGSEPEVDEYLHLVTPDLAVCPAGARFDETGGFCVTGTSAMGPFPQGLVAECQKLGGGAQCSTDRWDLSLAQRARGEEFCPAGTDIDVTTGLCTDGRFVYGPFDQTIIDDCRAAGGGAQCSDLRWDKSFAPLLSAEDRATIGVQPLAVPSKLDEACGANAKLFNYYKSQKGFMNTRKAARAKLRAIGATTAKRPDRNGCATYLSYALKQSGAVPNMPIEPGTEGFRDALLKRGWKVIKDPAQFQPGDVIISRDRKGWAGHPDHVYMLASMNDPSPGMGQVIDNQGTLVHARNITAKGSKTRAAYALRAPDAKNDKCGTGDCAGKEDGWYCAEKTTYAGYKCKGGAIASGYQCATGQKCQRAGSGDDYKAQTSGEVIACK